jgi:hypothetical protein
MHMGPKALDQILKFSSIKAKKSKDKHDIKSCSTCISAKHHQVYSRVPITRIDKPFMLIQSDLAGPFPSSMAVLHTSLST